MCVGGVLLVLSVVVCVGGDVSSLFCVLLSLYVVGFDVVSSLFCDVVVALIVCVCVCVGWDFS